MAAALRPIGGEETTFLVGQIFAGSPPEALQGEGRAKALIRQSDPKLVRLGWMWDAVHDVVRDRGIPWSLRPAAD